ncbi:MAG: hypothetical protein SV377_06795, partial [Halobacteria archaeon]|nr:hypothetical protein [Halobacteria archaeon]
MEHKNKHKLQTTSSHTNRHENIDDLIESARELRDRGLNSGEIADELNVSRETANWLLSHTGREVDTSAPADIHVDWSPIGRSSRRLDFISKALVDLILEDTENDPDVVVGIS